MKRKYVHRPETIKKIAERKIIKLVNKMKTIRATNNDLWMKIFLIACLSNPKQAIRVVPGIMKKDVAVNKTMKRTFETMKQMIEQLRR